MSKDNGNHTYWGIVLILAVLSLMVILALSMVREAEAQELESKHQFNRFLSPIWNPNNGMTWNLSKLGGYVAGGIDAGMTSQAQERAIGHGYRVRELNFIDGIFIDPHEPAWVKRQVSSFVIQYGLNLLLDLGYNHSRAGKWDRRVMVILRSGLTAHSLIEANRARGLGR